MTSLTPNTGCTVAVPAQAANTQTSISDPTLLGVTPTTGTSGAPAIWRFGLLEHAGVETRAPERWLAFTGTGTDPSTGKWGFHWVGQVRGALVTPTIRGSLKNGTRDQAPFYTSIGVSDAGMTAGSAIQATPDGRYVTFSSSSVNLSPNATAAGTKVFRYDTTTGALVVVSVHSGASSAPASCVAYNSSISSDGNKIAFQSSGCDLGFGTNRQIYLRNITAGTTSLVTHAPGTSTPGDGDSQEARISKNGNFVTFISASGNILAGRPAGRKVYDVYRYNAVTGLIQRANIGRSGAGSWPNGSQTNPDISSDGSRIVFDTNAQVLVLSDVAVNQDVFMYDFGQLALSQLSVTRTGALAPSSYCEFPTMSPNGASVAFACATGGADSFVASPTSTAGRLHIYRRTTAAASTIAMIDTSADGATEANAAAGSIPPAMNNDGQLVGYISTASNLLRTAACNTPTGACEPSPTGFPNAFVRDMGTPDPEVRRSFLVSQIRSRATAAVQPFVASERGVLSQLFGRTFDLVGARDGATAVYLASGGNSTDWSQDPSSGGYQVYLSPFSDALFQ
jgi:Tol biopolymer transport system component